LSTVNDYLKGHDIVKVNRSALVRGLPAASGPIMALTCRPPEY
jgi:hypothetical protein